MGTPQRGQVQNEVHITGPEDDVKAIYALLSRDPEHPFAQLRPAPVTKNNDGSILPATAAELVEHWGTDSEPVNQHLFDDEFFPLMTHIHTGDTFLHGYYTTNDSPGVEVFLDITTTYPDVTVTVTWNNPHHTHGQIVIAAGDLNQVFVQDGIADLTSDPHGQKLD